MKTAAFALALASLTVAGAAAAQTPTTLAADGRTPVVRYADLDLTREQGARALVGRIAYAAHVFCGPEPRAISLGEYMRYRACVAESTNGVVRRIDSPQVTAVFERELLPQQYAGR
jgi:UrcA family protein